jgi:cytochrome c heme-lyase
MENGKGWWSSLAGGCPVINTEGSTTPAGGGAGGCPVNSVDNNVGSYNPAINDINFGQQKQPDQKQSLSTVRQVSSIPKSDYTPAHQPEGIERWVYPSEQQYYNAMKRKGYNPSESDVPIVLTIHNLVNEQGWTQIKQWESLRGCSQPRLKQFMGRPQDLSLKARLMSLLGYSLPFDRHDWIVNRDGKDVRYIIDFYRGAQPRAGGAAISVYLDVRPAIDSPAAAYDRISVMFRKWKNGGIGLYPKELTRDRVHW